MENVQPIHDVKMTLFCRCYDVTTG